MNNYTFFKYQDIEIITITDSVINFCTHIHRNNFTVSVMVSGYAKFLSEDKSREIFKGNVYTAIPYKPHSIVSEVPVSLISVCIQKQSIYKCAETDLKERITKTFSYAGIYDEFAKPLSKAFADIYEKYHYSQDEIDAVWRKCIYGIEHDPEYGKISELARKMYMSEFHFIRQFKKASGLSPQQFRILCRVRKAQSLLGDISAADAAAETGFYDQSHFDRYFKRIVGISPSEYISAKSNFLQDE